ncbi:MAG: alkaline phosphatase D family protein [Oceanococcus sp.]
MPPTRRDIIKIIGAASASSLVVACGAKDRATAVPATPDPNGNSDFDFPTALALPFAHGVASGDPLSDRVIIWTRITQQTYTADNIPVSWFVATDPAMQNIVSSGSQNAIATHDWTIKVDVTGLSDATTYYYRFAALGAESMTGRTRTAPATSVDALRLAVVACSSYWSSHWSGYSHIAERNDLDLVVHCGDYIYDFVDQDEQVRARNDIKDTNHVDYRDWINLDECRRRYALFRSDRNHVRAHQQHPWTIVWDNHDISTGYGNELDAPDLADQVTTSLEDVCRAFYEWTPSRPPLADGSGNFLLLEDGSYPTPPDVTKLWRKLDFGPMADLFCVDTQLYLRDDMDADASHLESGQSLFSRSQFEWLSNGMLTSQQAGKTWRLVLNQTWIAPVTVPGVVPGFGETDPLGLSRWSSYSEERAAWFEFLRGNNSSGERIHNNIVMSGDVHGNWGADLVEDNTVLSNYQSAPPIPNIRQGSTPENIAAGYLRASSNNTALLNNRADSVGVEFAPTSMGRGGADELVANANPLSSVIDQIAGARALELAAITGNKATQFIEWVDHGYGIIHLTTERAVFEYWWQDKLTPDSPDVLGNQMVAFSQENTSTLPSPQYQDQLDYVVHHGESVTPTSGSRTDEPAPEAQFTL